MEPTARHSDDATDSFLGYLYQLRFALLGGLNLREPSDNVAVELLDDVRIATGTDNSSSLHQLKHSLHRRASLGAKSKNLWTTIGNWSEKVEAGTVDLAKTTLYMHTTGKITNQSPLSKLRLHDRDEKGALAQLVDAAASSASEAIARHAKKFIQLKKRQQRALVDQIIAIDAAANIAEAALSIEHTLAVSSRTEDLVHHRQCLEGWFFDRVITGLTGGADRRVSLQEIRNQSITIRDQLIAERLPGLEFTDIPSSELPDDDQRTFVKQLHLICSRPQRIRRAQTEHYQALTQRSVWSRDGKLAVKELPKFDSRLITEWEIRHESACQNSDECLDAEVEEAERVYRWVEEQAPSSAQLFIRRTFTEPFLIRGSYHMLADRKRVGWHPRFMELLGEASPSGQGDNADDL